MAAPRNPRYSPVNWLIVDWSFGASNFDDCCLPQPKDCPDPPDPVPEVCKTPLLVQEAIDTYDWMRWLPEVIVGIDDPDEEIAANYIREAAISFARRSRVMQRQILIPLQPKVCTYPVFPYVGENIVGVIGAAFDDMQPCCCHTHCAAFMPNNIDFSFDLARNEIRLESDRSDSCCGKARMLRVLVWAAPTEDACFQDTFLYEHFRKPIAQEARRTYARAVHFRDRQLMAVLPVEQEFERAIALAKGKAMAAHSWAKTKSGSGMWNREFDHKGTWR